MLDEGPLAHLAAHDLVAPPDLLFTGEAAEDNARRTSPVTSRLFGSGSLSVLSIADQTQAWTMLYSHLRRQFAKATQHFAEHEAIAICACDRRTWCS